MVKTCWIILQVLIGYHLIFPLCLLLLSKFRRKKKNAIRTQPPRTADYAIIVTAYQQTDMLKDVADSILKLNYSNYQVYVVADNCDISGLCFADERVSLLRPPVVLASNTASHFYAIRHFIRNHERLVIIDSDNLVHPELLSHLDEYFEKGFEAVQGVREAKNLNTTLACLDAARDIYYHFYDGKLLFESGSSATLAGSGMAFTVALYRECLENLNVSGAGFDKVLQAEIVKRDKRIAFAEYALVYDEKTSSSEQLVNQRSRWINTWFKYFRFGFAIMASGVRGFSKNQFLFGMVLLRPPLFIFILLSGLCMVINLFINPFYSFCWLLAFACFALGFWLALKNSDTDKRIYQSLQSIPKFIYYQVMALTKSRTANKRSVATVHSERQNINEINTKKHES